MCESAESVLKVYLNVLTWCLKATMFKARVNVLKNYAGSAKCACRLLNVVKRCWCVKNAQIVFGGCFNVVRGCLKEGLLNVCLKGSSSVIKGCLEVFKTCLRMLAECLQVLHEMFKWYSVGT